jgi:hypothetical protein
MNPLYWKAYNPSNPPRAGRYVVKTITIMGTRHIIQTNFSGKTWSCTNQDVTHMLVDCLDDEIN